MQQLPIEDRGYPVPKFVEWIDGKPDFRVASRAHYDLCVKRRVCWLCGMDLASKVAFNIGPMCAINRVSSEPPSHVECSRFAALACPFLVRPHARRREGGLPEDRESIGGCSIRRNPGVALVWITTTWELFPDGLGGRLFRVGEPTRCEWYCEGRPATRAEVLASIESGLPELAKVAQAQSAEAMRALDEMTGHALKLLPVPR